MLPITNIAARLKEYRLSKQLSFADMERLTGIPAQTLNRYELGQRSPKYDTAIHIASSLGVNLLWLLGFDAPETEIQPVSIKEDGRVREFIQLFGRLTPDQQVLVIAQIKGILSNQ